MIHVLWEYKTEVARHPDNQQEILDSLGLQGWELVSAHPLATHIGSVRFYFKRPIDTRLDELYSRTITTSLPG